MVKKQILTSFLIIFVILSLNWSFGAVPYLDVSIDSPVIERGNSGKIYFEVEEVFWKFKCCKCISDSRNL